MAIDTLKASPSGRKQNESRERPSSQKGTSHPGSTEKSKKDAKASKKTGDSSSSASAVNSTMGGTVSGDK